MRYIDTIFRLETSVKSALIDEPNVTVNPRIAEPVKWSEIELIGECDELFHGFNYNYAKGDITMDFTCESAYTLITQQYETYGVDTIVLFRVIERYQDGADVLEYVEYDGRINFSGSYTDNKPKRRVSATVVLNSIHTKIANRWDTEIDITSTQTLDNIFIQPPIEVEIPLNGQTLHEVGQTFIQRKRTESVDFPSAGFGGAYFVLPNMLPMKEESPTPNATTTPVADLGTVKGFSLLYGGVTTLDPTKNANQLLLVDNTNAGLYHLEIDWAYKINVSISGGNTLFKKNKFAILDFIPRVIIDIPGQAVQLVAMGPNKSGSGYTGSVEHAFDCHYSADLDLPSGSRVYVVNIVNCFLQNAATSINFTVQTINLRVFADRKTRAAASRTKAFGFVDALKHVAGSVTSVIDDNTGSGLLVGSLIEKASASQMSDGYATEYTVASGKQLRGLSKPPTFTMKNLMLFLSAQHVAGMLYEKDITTNIETIRIEEGPWFYRGDKIVDIDEIFEYTEKPNNDLIYGKIVVGYDKYPEVGPGVGEEFNTIREYKTPIIDSDKTLEIISPLIASSLAIEQQRRLGTKKVVDGVEVSSEQDAGEYDDDTFVLHVTNQTHADTVTFIVEPPTKQKPYIGNYIRFGGNVISRLFGGVALKAGDIITINGTGTPADGGHYIILNVVNGKPGTAPMYQVFNQDLVAGGPYACTWTQDKQPFKLRTNERLNSLGLTDPENVPNQELSPARMLHKWALWINSGLFYKTASDKLRCTKYVGNKDMLTQVKSTEAPLPGDLYKQGIYETHDVSIGELEKFDKLFRPEVVTCKGTMTKAQQRALFDAMQNRGPEDARLGFFRVKVLGKWIELYLRSISYKKSTGVFNLTAWKRRPDLDPSRPDCSYYFDYDLNKFVQDPTADPNLYGFCLIGEFMPV